VTPPNVIFIPASAVSPDQTISGTFDAGSGTGGAVDNDPSASPAITGLGTIIARGTSGQNRINIQFDTSANGDTFQTAYPNGTTAVLTYLGTTYTASSYTWVDLGTTLRLDGTDFDAFPASFSASDSYTLEFFL